MAFETTLELCEWIEKELGHDVSTAASSQRADILSSLDTAHKTILAGGGLLNFDPDGQRIRSDVIFPFARSANPKVVTLVAPITSGANVTATNGSNAISFDAAPSSASLAGWHIRVAGQDEVYRVTAHTAGATSMTLDGEFVGANVSAGTFELFKIQYTVGSSDILQLLSPIRSYDDEVVIQVVDKDEMAGRFPLGDISSEMPSMAAIIHESLGTVTLQFSSYPSTTERIEIDYVPSVTTLDTTSVDPVLPKHFRLVLAHLAAYFMLVRNDDDRAGVHLQAARDKYSELVTWSDKMMSSGDENYGRIVLSGFSAPRTLNFTKIT